MGFKKSAIERQLKATLKELEFYRGLLMDNQQVSFKQAHVIDIVLSDIFSEEPVRWLRQKRSRDGQGRRYQNTHRKSMC